nr:MAG TPA: hypothetical protein [Caudoviricetes sp.]
MVRKGRTWEPSRESLVAAEATLMLSKSGG